MAENKEITTLHPYMNRNKNRYPNVKDENIPDTIQRKMTAGTGISISPDNVISATGGDSYTRSETDALLETKADKTALNNAEKVIPTDIAVKNGKIGLEHDTTWLTNQNAITLGDGLTYDEATKTLKAESGFSLPINITGNTTLFNVDTNATIKVTLVSGANASPLIYEEAKIPFSKNSSKTVYGSILSLATGYTKTAIGLGCSGSHRYDVLLTTEKSGSKGTYFLPEIRDEKVMLITDKDIKTSLFGKYTILSANEGDINLYMHNLVIYEGGQSGLYEAGAQQYGIFMTILSSSNLVVNSIADLNTLLGTTPRYIECSGTLTDGSQKHIKAIDWKGTYATSYYILSDENDTTGTLSSQTWNTAKDVVTTI